MSCNRGHLIAQVRRPFRERKAALQQEPADLIDQRRAPMHEPVAHSMDWRGQFLEPDLLCIVSPPHSGR
jgi:hypothetical protein